MLCNLTHTHSYEHTLSPAIKWEQIQLLLGNRELLRECVWS